MNLQEIIVLMKELGDKCPKLEGNDFLIAPSKIPKSHVEGYEIHITGKFDDETRKCINDIAIEQKLSVTMEQTSAMIYKKKPF